MKLIPTRRMRTRTVILTMSRGVNKVPFDVSQVAFDVSCLLLGVWREHMSLLFPYVVTLSYVSSLAFYVGCVQMYRGFDL